MPSNIKKIARILPFFEGRPGVKCPFNDYWFSKEGEGKGEGEGELGGEINFDFEKGEGEKEEPFF